jgi:hypothetical protein
MFSSHTKSGNTGLVETMGETNTDPIRRMITNIALSSDDI